MVGHCNLMVQSLELPAGVSAPLVDVLGKIMDVYALGALLAFFHAHHRKRNAAIVHFPQEDTPLQTEVLARDHCPSSEFLGQIGA